MNWEKLGIFIEDTLTTLTTVWSSEKVHNEIEAVKSAAVEGTASVQESLNAHTARKDNPHGMTVEQIGAETPAGAQEKADEVRDYADTALEAHRSSVAAHAWPAITEKPTSVAASGLADAETVSGAQFKADTAQSNAIAAAAADATSKANMVQANLDTHAGNTGNPHNVTSEQVNTYVKAVIDSKITTAKHEANSYTDIKVANLVGSSPATLDTLYELAAALGNDPNFATTVTNAIATKETIENANAKLNQAKSYADDVSVLNSIIFGG